jgi:hypothetical protein
MPSTYEFRVRGRLDKRALERFDGFTAETSPAATTLRGTIDDQSALHGLLDRLQCLGLELVEVKRIGSRPP